MRTTGLLVRVAFQRANPTFGNFGSKAEIVHLPGCLEKMIVDEIFPRARRDIAMLFRDTLYSEPAVQAVIEEYRDRMRKWYTDTCADDSEEKDTTDKLGFTQKESPISTALVGLIVLGGFVAVTSALFHRFFTKAKPEAYAKMNIIQYATVQFFVITMISLPVKMVLWHMFKIKYVLQLPWFNI